MKQLFTSLVLITVFACGTTSKKYKELQPLGPDDPVQMFWSLPNLKYDEVCAIEAHGNNTLVMAFLRKEDFQTIFAKEARKCGADGVIYMSMTPVTHGDVIAYGTGIKIRSKASALNVEKIKTFSLAVRDRDQKKVVELIKDIPKKRDERAPSDDELINIGLYLTALEGLSCDENMVKLLQDEYEGRITQFSMVKAFDEDHPDANVVLCQNVMARSLPDVDDKTSAVNATLHYYTELLGESHHKGFKKKIAAFHDLLVASGKLISSACEKSLENSTCAAKADYLHWANGQKNVKVRALSRNANDVLTVLKE